ncbi:MAG: hypothetical protein KA174_01580 [Chitinophagales bacterium]|nr:hypothetical protein [Chitinophagales bacterium]
MKIKYIILITLCVLGCKKNTSNVTEEPNNPQLIPYLDSMMSALSIGSYNDVLTGKLEGNFGIYAYYYPYGANCDPSFLINTKLSGGVSIDTADRYNLINAGDLYVNNLKIIAQLNGTGQFVYSVVEFTNDSKELDKMYGKNNQIKLINGTDTVLNTNMYVPKNIVMKDVISCSTGQTSGKLKSGYKLNWNSDYANVNGVVLEISGKNSSGTEKYMYLSLPDKGYYIFTESDLNQYPKNRNPLGLNIALFRGGFVFLRGKDNRKYNFSFVSKCSFPFDLE